MAEANPGHSDPDAILQALLLGPSTVVLFGPGKSEDDGNTAFYFRTLRGGATTHVSYHDRMYTPNVVVELLPQYFVKTTAYAV